MLTSENIILNHQFASNGTPTFTEVSNTDWRNADQGWLVSTDSKWSEDLGEGNATANVSGAGGLTQIITNNNLNQGSQLISFDATNLGDDNNVLRLQVFGINGDFRLNQTSTDDPTSRRKDEPIEYATLLDTGNIADQSFDSTTFNQQVDFGNGYEYIVVKFSTRNVEEALELVAIDNVMIANILDPEVNDPEVNDPEVNDPEVNDPEANDPEVNNPQPEVELSNIVIDSQFSSDGTTTFTEVSNTDWRSANQGWLVNSDSKWSEDLGEGNATANVSGAGGLTQIIANNSLNQGLQLISFDALNLGDDDNVLQLQVFGINGDFRLNPSSTDVPTPRRKDESIEYATLLDTGNIAEQSFDSTTFSQQVDFGNGYQYIAIKFFTRNVEETSELVAIDNVIIADIVNPDPEIENPEVVNPENIITDGEFDSTQASLTEVSSVDWRNADQGWLVTTDSKWSENLDERYVIADNSGSGGLTQIITNNSSNKGLQLLSFDAINNGDFDSTLRLQIFGINGEFRLNPSDTDDPTPRRDDLPITYATLFDSGNIAEQQFDYSTFSQPVDFGEGYEYIAIKFFTRDVEASELVVIDNVLIADIPEHNNSFPVVLDDKVVTKKGISQTIDVLDNDIYSSQANIKIDNFTQPYNGTVTYENGKLYYVPDSHMVGQDSFEYTIIDNQGRIDVGTVEITIQNPTYDIGVNLEGISYYSPQHPFVDIFKTARKWIPQTNNTFDTKEYSLLDLDENGWVKSLPTAQDDVKYDFVTTVMNIDRRSHGEYVVLYEGEGTLVYSEGAQLISSEPGRDIIQTISSEDLVRISLIETDPNNTGDYLKDIRIVPTEYADIYQTSTSAVDQSNKFNPEFLRHIDSFSTLRFMDWMETNDSEQVEWSDRGMVDDYTYFKAGTVPVEVMVELANVNGSNAWFNMPHMATDEYVENFAQYVKENLDPELDVYIEYSNEIWNGNFQQARWVEEQAQLEGMEAGDWYSRRTTQITQIWDEVFAEDKERVLGVMGSWSARGEYGREILNYNWAGEEALSHEEYGIDVIAIAPYFGGYIGSSKNTKKLQRWAENRDSGVNKLYKEITEGGYFNNSPEGGALQAAFEQMEEYALISKEQGLPLVAYEGGQHIVSQDQNSRVIKMFEELNRDPRMGKIYEDYLQKWFEIGGGEFVTFNDVRQDNEFGSWGLSESLNQNTPKYEAVTDLANTLV